MVIERGVREVVLADVYGFHDELWMGEDSVAPAGL